MSGRQGSNQLDDEIFGPAPAVLLVPIGRLHPSEWNPRTIKDERFVNLCRSLEADPQFLWRRPILANESGVVMAGNMRLRAALHLGWETIPAIVEDVPDTLARERALRDNGSWGDWADDDLAEMLRELRDAGAAIDLLGFDAAALDALLAEVSGETAKVLAGPTLADRSADAAEGTSHSVNLARRAGRSHMYRGWTP